MLRAYKTELDPNNKQRTQQDDLLFLVNCIPDPVVRSFTLFALDNAPSHFWLNPSSAGKYHPADEHGFEGLLLHTIRVVKVGIILCESALGRLKSNVILPACILHDICRYGDSEVASAYTVNEHPELAANMIYHLALDRLAEDYAASISNAVRCHMGRWGSLLPSNETEWVVHYADRIAANYHRLATSACETSASSLWWQESLLS